MNIEHAILFKSKSGTMAYGEALLRYLKAHFVFAFDKVTKNGVYQFIVDKDRANMWQMLTNDMFEWDLGVLNLENIRALVTSDGKYLSDMTENMLLFIEFYAPSFRYDGKHVMISEDDVLKLKLIGVMV